MGAYKSENSMMGNKLDNIISFFPMVHSILELFKHKETERDHIKPNIFNILEDLKTMSFMVSGEKSTKIMISTVNIKKGGG